MFHNTFFLTYRASPKFQVGLFLNWEVSRLWLGRRLSHPPNIDVLDQVVIHWMKIVWRWKPDLGREYWRSGTIHTQLCVLSDTAHLEQQQDENLTSLLWHQDYNFHFCKKKKHNALSWQSGYRHFGQREGFSSSWREKVQFKSFFCNTLLVNILKLSVRVWLHFILWNSQGIGGQGSLVCRARPQQAAEEGFIGNSIQGLSKTGCQERQCIFFKFPKLIVQNWKKMQFVEAKE